jgi:uncharacterized membrane protein YozB (DUF420 family)
MVAIAMFVILPALALGIQKVKVDRNYVTHKATTLAISITLAISVVLFEVEMRLVGWRHLAEKSPYYETYIFPTLSVHLFFSISTTLLLTATVYLATRKFPDPSRTLHSFIQTQEVGDFVCRGACYDIYYRMDFLLYGIHCRVTEQ